jgi:DNA-binding GntR family transcriptional regulator
MPLAVRKIVPATLRQQIVQEIRQSILNRSLLPGERLVERELASRLGTSLTAVREALIQLEMEGLITKRPNAATHVVELTPEEVNNIYAVRHVLEHYAFQEAARMATREDIQELQDLHERAVHIARQGQGVAYITADLEWHEAVWRATGNHCLVETLHRVTLPLFGFSSIEMATSRGFDLAQDALSHEPLLSAIRSHDPALVSKAFKHAEVLWQHQTKHVPARSK